MHTEVKQIATKHRFNSANIEKVLRLVDLLREIYAHPFLEKRFALKGGTAINVFIFDMPRLSVDIDINYIGAPEKEIMLTERALIREHLRRIFQLQRYEIEFSENYGSDRFDLWYPNISDNRDRVKVEINYLLRTPLLKPIISKKRKLFSAIELPRVLILAPEELFASKMIALMARHAARDLYDIDQLSMKKDFALKKRLLKTCAIFYGIINREDFRKMSPEIVGKVSHTDIKRTLSPLLQRGLNYDLAKSQDQVKQFLKPLFRFTKKERQFVDSFFEGIYEPSLIFNSNTFSPGISRHPMVEWKLSHIAKQLSLSRSNVT